MRKCSDHTTCEICGLYSHSAIELHHIIPRTDPRSTDSAENIAIICGSCHNEVHAGDKIIEGRYLTSAGDTLFWRKSIEGPTIRYGIILLSNGLVEIID